jgi:hypothetical protein
MKCPYPDCQKDYNDKDWPKVWEDFVTPPNFCGSIAERSFYNRIYLVSRKCRFCGQFFHEVYVGKDKFDKEEAFKCLGRDLEFLCSYPVSKTRFTSPNIPKKVRDAFNEAESCRSIGSLTGAGACLRKAIYALCDDKKAQGEDYRKKILNLPVKNTYKELLRQVKWLGDSTTKPEGEGYTMEMVDGALEILPVVIDELYAKDERAEKVAKLLAKVRSQNPPK